MTATIYTRGASGDQPCAGAPQHALTDVEHLFRGCGCGCSNCTGPGCGCCASC